MNKKRIKILGSAVLATSIIFSTANAVMAAPAKSTKDVTTGRTEQNRQTGVITLDPVTVPHYAENVTLSGTVVIDGPQLVLKVNDIDVSAASNLQKVADKTWTYSYKASLNKPVDSFHNVNFNIEAYTIYPNGKPSPDIHTSAPKATQTVHVPYVESFAYANLTWDTYDRDSNIFGLSYDLIRIWDDGVKETVQPRITDTVEGTKTYTITASDKTHNNWAIETLGVAIPPIKVRDFSFSNDSFSNYDKTDNTYLLTFTLHKELSNGSNTEEVITVKVAAGSIYEYTAVDSSSPGAPYSETFAFKAPAAPVAPIPTVKNISVTVTNQEEVANNEDKNNYKVTYDLTVTLSDNKTYTFNNLVITIPYNPGNSTASKTVTEDRAIDGVTYSVTYTVSVKFD